MSRYTFTQPKTKLRTADYVHYLKMVQLNKNCLKWRSQQVRYYNMTFQALREAGLISYSKGFELTQMGAEYLRYVEFSNKPRKEVLKSILKGNK